MDKSLKWRSGGLPVEKALLFEAILGRFAEAMGVFGAGSESKSV